MNTSLLVIFIFLAAACLLLITFRRNKVDSIIAPSAPKQMNHGSNHVSEIVKDFEFDLAIFDENGLKVLESKEIEKIPARAHLLESSSSAINRVKHLASDLFKGAANVPKKSVEVIFKPEIHQGLSDGTYTLMRTKTGEVLADAVDSSGKIVGKGRIIQAGKARQLAGGAFQLVSIAVAQSHLADIERSLTQISHSTSASIASKTQCH